MTDKTKNPIDLRKEVRKVENRFEVLRTVLALIISLIIILAIIFIVDDKPLDAIKTLLFGPLSSFRRFGNVIELMVPLTFTGLALTIVFTTNRFNLAADGAFYMGSIIAVFIGLNFPGPPALRVVVAILAGFLTGAIIGLIPALLDYKFKADVLVTSLMLNYVVEFFVNYIFNYSIRDPGASARQSLPLPEGVNLGRMFAGTRIHYGLIIMVILVVVTALVFYKTKRGFTLRAVGSNERFAKYIGINVPIVVVVAQAIGTGIAGLGGAVEILGKYKVFLWNASPGLGFDGVIIATLARLNPKYVPLAAFFLAYVRTGADILNRSSAVPAEIISIVQATIILLIASKSFLAKRQEKAIIKVTEENKEA